VPQGLAGNSAYIIKPKGAEELIMAVEKYGAWPNDAIMCKQLIPNMGVTRRFYTKVQGLPSTTTG
jgi:GR25 family glycosyltransferase involved in LPS biosynthesis